MNGKCYTCKYLIHSNIPSAGWCCSPKQPEWQSDNRAVVMAAVKYCKHWKPQEEHDDESVC